MLKRDLVIVPADEEPALSHYRARLVPSTGNTAPTT